jgi:hypothetical protein
MAECKKISPLANVSEELAPLRREPVPLSGKPGWNLGEGVKAHLNLRNYAMEMVTV